MAFKLKLYYTESEFLGLTFKQTNWDIKFLELNGIIILF